MKRVIALAFFVGALPFVFSARTYASEMKTTSQEPKAESRWLDDYSKPVGFTYGAQARIQPAYMWRGLYCGAANIQASANVGYGGLYLDMWWNIGVTDWTFNTFQPEVDFSLGFSRWGLDIYALYIHNFNTGFFDFHNYPDKGNRLELNARYTISSKLPLCFVWATRIAASDGYLNAAGDTIQAYSSYSNYKGDFVVNNVELRLRKDWSVSEHCGLMLQGQLCINPSAIAADKSSVKWNPTNPGNQSVNANIAYGVYLK